MNKLDIILRHESYQANRSQGSPSRFLASPDTRVKLSTSIDKSSLAPQELKLNMLNLQNRYIEELDVLPAKYKKVHTIVLNNNHLKNLRGIEQFTKLKKLDVADNQLDDILNVYYLAALPLLEEIDFRGNDIVNIPNYRDTMLLFIPGLKVLDGKAVKAQEKAKVSADVKKQYVLLEKLLGNYIELIKLQSIAKKLEVHKELFNRDRKFLINFIKFDVAKFKKMYNYFQDIDEKVRNDYRADLLRDVRTIEVNFLQRDDMETAVQELSSRQLAKIAELTKQIEKKASVLQSVYSANIHKLKRFKVEDNFNVEPEKFKSPTKYPAGRFGSPNDSRISQRYGGNMKSYRLNESMRGALSPGDGNFRPIKSERDMKLRELMSSQSGEKNGSNSRYGSRSRAGTREWGENEYDSVPRSGHRKMKSVNLVQGSPGYGEEDVPRQLSVSQAQPVDNEGYEEVVKEEVIPKELVVEKDREITQLARDLQDKIAEVIRISGINKQLKDRLREFEEQNQENARIAQEEAGKIMQQVQANENLHRELAKEAKELRQYLQELVRTNEELENEKDQLEQENSQLMVFKDEVKIQQMLDEKEKLAEDYHNRRLLKKGFRLLDKAVHRSRMVEQMYRTSKEIRAYNTQQTVFEVLKKAMIIRRIGRYQQRERAILLLQDIVTAWRDITRKKKVANYWRSKRESDRLYAAFICWSHYRDIRFNKESIRGSIQGFYQKKLLRKSMEGFRKIFVTFRLEEKVEAGLTDVALNYHLKRVLRDSFSKWKDYHKTELMPKRLKTEIAKVFYTTNLKILGFQIIQTNLQLCQLVNKEAEILLTHRNQQIVANIFNKWKTDFRVLNGIRGEEKRLQHIFYLKKRFETWRREFLSSQRSAALDKKADSHYQDQLIVKSFDRLALSCMLAKRRRIIYKQIVAYKISSLMTNNFKKWRRAFLEKKRSAKRNELIRLEAQRQYFDRWLEFWRQEKEDRLINGRALRLREKGLGRYVALIFKAWRAWGKWSKKNKKVLKDRKENKVKKVYRKVFEELRLLRIRGLKEKYNALNKEYQADEARVMKAVEEIRSAEQERVELIEKLEDLKNDTLELKDEIQNQDRYVEKCKDHIMAKEDAIAKLEREITERERETDKVEKENKKMLESIQKKSREFEGVQNEFLEERGRLNEEVLKLERELDRRTRAVEEAERDKRQESNELEDIVRRNEEIIDGLCQELKELKSALGLKEQEVRESTELIGEFEVRNRALKDQVEDTLNDMERSSVDYTQRIQQLEIQNQILLEQMRGLDRQGERQVEELRELKDLVRKFEQEASSIAEQQHRDTEEFIRNLHRSRIVDDQVSSRYSQRMMSPQKEDSGRLRSERPTEDDKRESVQRDLQAEKEARLNTSATKRQQGNDSGDVPERLTGNKYYMKRTSHNPIYEEALSREDTRGDDVTRYTPRSQFEEVLAEGLPNIQIEGKEPMNEK